MGLRLQKAFKIKCVHRLKASNTEELRPHWVFPSPARNRRCMPATNSLGLKSGDINLPKRRKKKKKKSLDSFCGFSTANSFIFSVSLIEINS